jgi:NH3-dependent NAD+ synthetase
MEETVISKYFAAMVLAEMKKDKTFETEMYQIIMQYYLPNLDEENIQAIIRFLNVFEHSTAAQLLPMFEAMLPAAPITVNQTATQPLSASNAETDTTA